MAKGVDIAIVGGGPAGLSAALRLAKRGVPSTVFESRTRSQIDSQAATESYDLHGRSYALALRERGLGLIRDTHPTAHTALLRAAILQPKTFLWTTANGPPRQSTTGEDGAENVYVTRDTVIGALLQAADEYPDTITVRYEMRLMEVATGGPGCTKLHFKTAAGAEETVDARVVVGADGVNSKIRRFVEVKTGAEAEEYVDPTPYKFALLPPSPRLGTDMHVFVARGVANAIVLPFKDGHQSVSILASPKITEVPREWLTAYVEGAASHENRARMAAFFERHFPSLVEHIRGDSKAYGKFLDDVLSSHSFPARTLRMSVYHHGSVCLLGDAAHATLPTTGQGLTSALLDAKCLVDSWDGTVAAAPKAFAAYSTNEAPDRAALFHAGKWVAGNRWAFKYVVFMISMRPLLFFHRYLPGLVSKPLYAGFSDPTTRYADAWKSFCRQAIVFKVMLAALALLLLYGLREGFSATPWEARVAWAWGVVVCVVGGHQSPLFTMGTGKHMTIVAILLYGLVGLVVGSPEAGWDLSKALYCLHIVTMIAYSLRLYAGNNARSKEKSFRERYPDTSVGIPRGARIGMAIALPALYCIYASPVFINHGRVSAHASSLRAGAGLVMSLAGFILQAWADRHKQSVKSLRGGNVMVTDGPFVYSRHPNYFGEIVVWWGWMLGCMPLECTAALLGLCGGLMKYRTMSGAAGRIEMSQRKRYTSAADVKYFDTTPVLNPFTKRTTLQ